MGDTTSLFLTDGWQVRQLAAPDAPPPTVLPPIQAQVPGFVHLDLMRAGAIPDPFARLYERTCAWVDDADWEYSTTFTLDAIPPGEAWLTFHGLDTFAEISLNGREIGRADNMFVARRFRAGEHLVPGKNTLAVVLRSARRVGNERHKAWNTAYPADASSHWDFSSAREFVRKAQYMFGWDWGPVLISCGIWRPVELAAPQRRARRRAGRLFGQFFPYPAGRDADGSISKIERDRDGAGAAKRPCGPDALAPCCQRGSA